MNDSMNVAGNAINNPGSDRPRTRSTFPTMSYHLFNTERFGEYSPCFVMEGVEGDKIPVQPGGSVQSYTLKAPLMQSINKKKDFYVVPMPALLPLNWDKFYMNPTIGDDVPDDVGTGVANFWYKVVAGLEPMKDIFWEEIVDGYLAESPTFTSYQVLNGFFRMLLLHEMFFSNGSLIASLGCKGSRYLRIKNLKDSSYTATSFDAYFDYVINLICKYVDYFFFTDSDGYIKVCICQENDDTKNLRSAYACVSIHGYLQYMRDDLNVHINHGVGDISWNDTYDEQAFAVILQNLADTTEWSWDYSKLEVPYNLARVFSYQVVCSHFYSNDHVDYIYSADLYRQLIFYCIHKFYNTENFFTCNGLKYQYDYLSAYYFDKWIDAPIQSYLGDYSEIIAILTDDSDAIGWRGYASNVFSYRRSLRFVDYFTGARTRPLAVGDVNIDVNASKVDVVDVSRNIQKQRFLNAVHRFGRKVNEYIKGLSGQDVPYDYHNPAYLAHFTESVYGVQVENTGAAQFGQAQSVTSRLTSNGGRYRLEFECNLPCVIIGISYYDIRRSYLYSCDRQLMHLNRFDMFNPFMQFIGDQPVFFAEIGAGRSLNYNGTFGYQIRHMEYKQRFDVASGGFVENLPGYLFTNKDDEHRIGTGNVSPDFIRSLNEEIDEFYLSLTGYSLGSYFHFIVDNDNRCEPSRPMAFAPTIL